MYKQQQPDISDSASIKSTEHAHDCWLILVFFPWSFSPYICHSTHIVIWIVSSSIRIWIKSIMMHNNFVVLPILRLCVYTSAYFSPSIIMGQLVASPFYHHHYCIYVSPFIQVIWVVDYGWCQSNICVWQFLVTINNTLLVTHLHLIRFYVLSGWGNPGADQKKWWARQTNLCTTNSYRKTEKHSQ